MNYSLFILPRPQKELAQLNAGAFARLRDAIRELTNDPRPPGCLKSDTPRKAGGLMSGAASKAVTR